jgi:hypothetical protein
LQTGNAPEFPDIIGNYHQIFAARMTRDQHVVGTAGDAGTCQFRPKLSEVGGGAQRKGQDRKVSNQLFDSAPIFDPSGRSLDPIKQLSNCNCRDTQITLELAKFLPHRSWPVPQNEDANISVQHIAEH